MEKKTKAGLAIGLGAAVTAGAGVVMTTNYLLGLAIKRDGKLSDITGTQNVMGRGWDQYHEKIVEGEEWYYTCEFEDLEIYSQDALKLKGKLFEHCDEVSKGVVIMCHGYRGNGRKDLSYMAKKLYSAGYDVVIIDQRATNQSQGKYLTFGEKEAEDMACWVNYISKINPEKKIYLYGISMGATTVLLALEHRDVKVKVSAVIADCGYTCVGVLAKRFMKSTFHIPEKPFYQLANILFKGKTGCDFNKSTVDVLRRSHVPVMFIHGSDDKFVPERMSRINFQASASQVKKLVIVPGAAHGQSVFVDTVGVTGKMIRFMEKA